MKIYIILERQKVTEKVNKETGLVEIKSTYYETETYIQQIELSIGTVTTDDINL